MIVYLLACPRLNVLCDIPCHFPTNTTCEYVFENAGQNKSLEELYKVVTPNQSSCYCPTGDGYKLQPASPRNMATINFCSKRQNCEECLYSGGLYQVGRSLLSVFLNCLHIPISMSLLIFPFRSLFLLCNSYPYCALSCDLYLNSFMPPSMWIL